MNKNLIIIIVSVLFFSCSKEVENNTDKSIINLSWSKAYYSQTIDDVVGGLNWTLSNVGIYKKSENSEFLIVSDSEITLLLNELNFESDGRRVLMKLHESIFNSEEYKKKGSIDVGRYVCLLVGASNHYFELVGIPNNIQNLLVNYQTLPQKGKVNNSSVSFEHRILEYTRLQNSKQLFLSTEVDSTTNSVLEYETIEIMKNGKLKFGIYDKNGFRKTEANSLITNAGKIAKCMWCHESNLAPLIQIQDNFSGYLSAQQLKDTLQKHKNQLFQFQKTISNSLVNFTELQEHVKMELLYISFMEPSAIRLGQEWGISPEDVKARLRYLSTHTHPEFPFLGILYDRNEVELYSPFNSLEVSSSVREKSIIEVNHL